MSSHPFWVEGVDMRRWLHSPKVPARMQGNVMTGAISETAPFPKPTVSDVAFAWPLPKLASYIRQLTNSATQEALDALLGVVATVHDKSTLEPPDRLEAADRRCS